MTNVTEVTAVCSLVSCFQKAAQVLGAFLLVLVLFVVVLFVFARGYLKLCFFSV